MSKLNKILTISESIGFDACGISSASDLEEEKPQLNTWLQNGMNGEMVSCVRKDGSHNV